MHISSLVQEHATSHTAGYNSAKRQDGTYLQAAVANSVYTRCREYQGMLPSFPSHNASRHTVATTEASLLCIYQASRLQQCPPDSGWGLLPSAVLRQIWESPRCSDLSSIR